MLTASTDKVSNTLLRGFASHLPKFSHITWKYQQKKFFSFSNTSKRYKSSNFMPCIFVILDVCSSDYITAMSFKENYFDYVVKNTEAIF